MTAAFYDLHSHSTASDGSLTPAELVNRALHQGVQALALTDHDTVAGLSEASQAAQATSLKLIPGIELSANWNGQCYHIIGLGIDPEYPPLITASKNLQQIRLQRAEKIAGKLVQKKIYGALEAVLSAAGDSMVTRNHFADFLLAQNFVSSKQDAFDRFLGQGKPAFVATEWAELTDTVNWITGSGGIAVLAHPMRYKLTTARMLKLLAEFKTAGGSAIEVVTGQSNSDEIRRASGFAKRLNLAASCGSDFHTPNQWIELGRLADMPIDLQPVWELF